MFGSLADRLERIMLRDKFAQLRGEADRLTRRAESAESAVDVLEKSHASLGRQLAEEHRENERLRAALQKITEIENRQYGPDWEEIDEARGIASEAIATKSQSGG
jgi:chromosome segregation ATPase